MANIFDQIDESGQPLAPGAPATGSPAKAGSVNVFDQLDDNGKPAPAASAQASTPAATSEILGTTDFGSPIFASPKDNAAMNASTADYIKRVGEKALEGATFGTAPYLEAGVGAATGTPYDTALKNARAYTAETAQKYPGSSMAAEGLGAAVPTIATAGLVPPAASWIGRAGQAAAGGAAVGGLSAAGHDIGSGNTGDLAQDTGYGAVTGAVAGGGLSAAAEGGVAPIAARVIQHYQSVPTQIRNRVAGLLVRDQNAGVKSVADVAQGLAQSDLAPGYAPKPLTLADTGGPLVQGEAERVATLPQESGGIVKQALLNRQSGVPGVMPGAATRLSGDVGTGIGQGSAFNTTQSLMYKRSSESAPLYAQAFQGGSIAPLQDQLRQSLQAATGAKGQIAKQIQAIEQNNPGALAARGAAGAQTRARYMDLRQQLQQAEGDRQATLQMFQKSQSDAAANAPGAVWNPRIQQFLNDPIMKQGLARGIEIQRLEALAQGKPFNPTEYAITGADAQGQPIVGTVPNMRTLDAGKKGLDAIVQDERNPVTGSLSQYGRAVDQVRRAYLGQIDAINPDYAAARAVWGGTSASMDAVRSGQALFTKHPDEIANEISNLQPGTEDFYRLGAAQALRDQIARRGTYSVANSIVGRSADADDWTAAQLRPLFQSDQDFADFMKAPASEKLIGDTNSRILANSASARRLLQHADEGQGEGVLAPLATGAAGMMFGEPIAGVPALLRAVRNWPRTASAPANPAVNAGIARTLTSTNPQDVSPIIAEAMRRLSQRKLSPGGFFASAGQAPALLNYQPPVLGYEPQR